MKKLKLKALELGATELLTRDQLKNLLGGVNVGSGEGSFCFNCYCADGGGSLDFGKCGTFMEINSYAKKACPGEYRCELATM